MDQPLILIVDDDPDLSQLLTIQLEGEGYRTLVANDGQSGIERARIHSPDLIILDVTMPNMSGLEVCERVREFSAAPILMLTARTRDQDAAVGLDTGADDYVTKPYSPIELQARVRALLRRVPPSKTIITAGNGKLRLDRQKRELKLNEKAVDLTPTEYQLLNTLAEHVGEVVTHQTLLNTVWGTDSDSEHDSLKVYIWHLRRKLEENPRQPQILLTEWGIGYRLAE